MHTHIPNESPCQHVAKMVLVGGAFAGLGAVLNLYVPAFHCPAHWLHTHLDHANGKLASFALTKPIFAGNPLTCNSDVTRFLALNAVETPFIAGSMIGLGALAKALGIESRGR